MYSEVPRINVGPLFDNNMSKKMEIARQIDKACRGSGFFLAENHGIDVKALAEVTTRFHMTITEEEKWNIAIEAYNKENYNQKRNGYYMAVEGKKAVQSYCYLNPSFNKDHLKIKEHAALHEVNVWPDEKIHPGFRQFQEKYFRDVFEFSRVLLRGFSLGLGKNENFFDKYVSADNTLSSVSLIRYPFLEDYPPIKVAEDGTKLSFEKHKDVSLITVLYQSMVENLQVETQNGFMSIPATDDCYLVNAGTFMAHITSNYYHAPVHRVKFVNAERLSLPFFLNLDDDSEIEPFIPHSNESSENTLIPYGVYLNEGLHRLIITNGQT